MSGGFALGAGLCNAQSIADVSASIGTSVTASSSANTKGSYVQLSASTPYDASWIELQLFMVNGGFNAPNVVLDLAIGASGSEVIVASNILCGSMFANDPGKISVVLPIKITAGSRLAARIQSDNGSQVAGVLVTLFDSAFCDGASFNGVTDIGFNAGTSYGTVIAPSSTANTKGSWTQLIAATAADYFGLFGSFNTDHTATTNCNYLVDIGIGASGSEVVISPNHLVVGVSGDSQSAPQSMIPFRFMEIPAGTRIAARSQASLASASGPMLTMYGVF